MTNLKIMDNDIFMDWYPGDYIMKNKLSLKEISKKYPELISIAENFLECNVEFAKFLIQEIFYHMILFRYDKSYQKPHIFRSIWKYQIQLSLICKDTAILNYLRKGNFSNYESFSSYCYTETACRIDTEYNEIDGLLEMKFPIYLKSDYDRKVYDIDYILSIRNIEEYLYENSKPEYKEFFYNLLEFDK